MQITLENTFNNVVDAHENGRVFVLDEPTGEPTIVTNLGSFFNDEEIPLVRRLAIAILFIFKIAIVNKISLYQLTETALIISKEIPHNAAFTVDIEKDGSDETNPRSDGSYGTPKESELVDAEVPETEGGEEKVDGQYDQ